MFVPNDLLTSPSALERVMIKFSPTPARQGGATVFPVYCLVGPQRTARAQTISLDLIFLSLLP